MLAVVDQLPCIRIAGFGACMISGFPHESGGFFDVACAEIERQVSIRTEKKLCSLGGFPAPRAKPYLASKLLGFRPDYLIIQLAALDALCPVRPRAAPSSAKKSGGASTGAQKKPASLLSYGRWLLLAMIGAARRAAPTTPLADYRDAMASIIDTCVRTGVTPVILTPFVYGSPYSMRSGALYAETLRELVAARPGALLVDCMTPLRQHPKHVVLQHDGFHLSLLAHSIVGQAIAARVVEHLAMQPAGNQAGTPARLASSAFG